MKFAIRRTTQFNQDVKHLLRRGKDLEQLLSVIHELAEGRTLAPEYLDHPLKGKYAGKRDCHLEPDWLLIYALESDELVLYRTGSHAQLFR